MALFFVVLAAGAAVLGVFLSRRGFDWAAKFSEIASFVLAGLAFLLPVAGKIVRWLPAPRIKDEQVEHDLADLAAALRAQGRFEGVQPGANVYDRLPMPVRWEPAEEVMSGTWPGISGFEAADPDGTLAGTFDEVLEFFRQLPEPRLVVLGEAGAGKTVLAMELARRLLAAWQGDDPLPVIVPVAAWDPGTTTLFDWIAGQLIRTISGLGRRVSDGRRTITRAQVLVDRIKVLPILDGLDELPESSRPTATLAINRYGWSQPLVVTCRNEEYVQIIEKEHGTPVARAAVIKLQPLHIADIKGYLGPDADGHWAAIYDRLDAEPGGALTQALANPLMLWLTWAVYSGVDRYPDELADRSRFGSPAAIERHLLAEFVPAIYPDGDDRSASPLRRFLKTRRRPQRWLGFLASDPNLHNKRTSQYGRRTLDSFETRDMQNVAWWRFTEAAGSLRFLGVVIRAALLTIVLLAVIMRILTQDGSWRNGAYRGNIDFREAFLDGPLGRIVWPTVRQLILLGPAKTRLHASNALNDALRDDLNLSFPHMFLIIIAIVSITAIYVSKAKARRPRRINIRAGALILWLGAFPFSVLLVVILMWEVTLLWNRLNAVPAFFSSHSTWITVLVISLAMSVLRWPSALTSEIDVVGVMTPLDSLRADKWADAFVTASRRTLFAVVVALFSGPQVALDYIFFAAAATSISLVLGGLNGFAARSYTDACIWLAIRRQLPWRPLHFLIDAERRGVFQEVGAIYRFRHVRVQLQLQDWYRRHRPPHIEEWWPQRLNRLRQHTRPLPLTLARIRDKADSYRILASQNLAEFGPGLATALSELADVLRIQGYGDEELASLGEIVETFRRMVEIDSGALPPLAQSLERFADRLAMSGRYDEALGVMNEATEIYCQLSKAERDGYVSRLADRIVRLLQKPPSRGYRYISAITDRYRRLVLTEPENETVDYANSLIRLAKVLRMLRRNDKAIDAINNAVKIHVRLARTESGAISEKHAKTLIELAESLKKLEGTADAAYAISSATGIYRKLAKTDPIKYRFHLAESLTSLVKLFKPMGGRSELKTIQEAVLIYQYLAEENAFDNLDVHSDLVLSEPVSIDHEESLDLSVTNLSYLAMRLWKLGERRSAIDAAGIGRRLAAMKSQGYSASAPRMSWDPVTEHDLPIRLNRKKILTRIRHPTGDPGLEMPLANDLKRLVDERDIRAFRLLAAGQDNESLAASREAAEWCQRLVEVYRNLSSTDPAGFLRYLADSLDELAAQMRKVGSREREAQAAAGEAQNIRRRLGLAKIPERTHKRVFEVSPDGSIRCVTVKR